jgi:DNA-binding GntR family transcriptional regulator
VVAPDEAGAPSLPAIGQSGSLVDEVADSLRDLIISGRLAPGERLNEVHLATELGISRGPLREALQHLRGEGLLELVPRRGSFVVALSIEDVVDIYELRAAIEGRAARILATRADAKAFRELRTLLDRLRRAADSGRAADVRRHDLAFHEAICRLTGNRRLHQAFQSNVPILRSLLKLDEVLYASQPMLAREHEVLLEVIESGDPDRAEAEAVRHLESARDLVTAYLSRT